MGPRTPAPVGEGRSLAKKQTVAISTVFITVITQK